MRMMKLVFLYVIIRASLSIMKKLSFCIGKLCLFSCSMVSSSNKLNEGSYIKTSALLDIMHQEHLKHNGHQANGLVDRDFKNLLLITY